MKRFGRPERVEKAVIKLIVNDKHEKMTVALQRHLDNVCPDLRNRYDAIDRVKIEWDFTIEYYNTERELRSLLALLREPDVIVDATMFEKSGGQLLIRDLIVQLEEVSREIAARS